ncbi:MAG: ferredoxin [Hyphomicrobiales bacterium]|nr:MAG: ferredoxin [Hyphomicrobiales bacterium]
MRIDVDRSRCTGIGICESIAEDYFEVADDGSLTLLNGNVPASDLERVRDGVRACPARALALVEEQ